MLAALFIIGPSPSLFLLVYFSIFHVFSTIASSDDLRFSLKPLAADFITFTQTVSYLRPSKSLLPPSFISSLPIFTAPEIPISSAPSTFPFCFRSSSIEIKNRLITSLFTRFVSGLTYGFFQFLLYSKGRIWRLLCVVRNLEGAYGRAYIREFAVEIIRRSSE